VNDTKYIGLDVHTTHVQLRATGNSEVMQILQGATFVKGQGSRGEFPRHQHLYRGRSSDVR
jgi:hypothetical protein